MSLPKETFWRSEDEHKLLQKDSKLREKAMAKALWADPEVVVANGGFFSYMFKLLSEDPEYIQMINNVENIDKSKKIDNV